jgi:hypothetical protein
MYELRPEIYKIHFSLYHTTNQYSLQKKRELYKPLISRMATDRQNNDDIAKWLAAFGIEGLRRMFVIILVNENWRKQ